MELPLEFIPPTIVLIAAAVFALLVRLGRKLNAPAEEQGDFFADIEKVFEPGPEELPADEAAEVHRLFAEIVSVNPKLDRRLTAIAAAAKAIPAQRSNEEEL